MRKHTVLITLTLSAITLFAVAYAVSAQTFTEPTPTTTLPAPITTTDKGQGIVGKFAVGTTIQDAVNILDSANATLYVKGSTSTRLNVAASVKANLSVASSNLFNITDSRALIGTASCAQSSQLCIQGAAGGTPALYVESVSGNALYGETSIGGSAGIFAEGYYGIQATATTSQAFAAYGVSCKEVVGSPGVCDTYGDAGYFNGDVKIATTTVGGVPNIPTGYYGGNGSGLFKVGSIQNKNTDAPNEGIMYKTFSGNIPSASLSAPVTIPANTVGIIGVESNDGVGNTFIPIGKAVTYAYNGTILTLRHATGTIHYYKLVVMYIAP